MSRTSLSSDTSRIISTSDPLLYHQSNHVIEVDELVPIICSVCAQYVDLYLITSSLAIIIEYGRYLGTSMMSNTAFVSRRDTC